MNRILTGALIGAASLIAAAPAVAQSKDVPRISDRTAVRGFDGQLGSATQRIDWLAERRQISARQYRTLRSQSASLRERLYNVAQDGFDSRERGEMADRISDLRGRITDARDAH